MLDTRWKEYMIYYDDDNPALDMVLAGKVTEVCFDGETVTATADGFQVSVSLREGIPIDCHCNCARESAHCVHMSAALYALQAPGQGWEQETRELLHFMCSARLSETEEKVDDVMVATRHAVAEALEKGLLIHALELATETYRIAEFFHQEDVCYPNYQAIEQCCHTLIHNIFSHATPPQRRDILDWTISNLHSWDVQRLSCILSTYQKLPWHPAQSKKLDNALQQVRSQRQK